MNFENLNIVEPILKALKEEGYTKPTPIQEKSIPHVIEGNDFLGCAQTGTGKTAAFAIPVLQNVYNNKQGSKEQRKIKALILAPTRELAIQIGESFTTYGKYTGLRNTVIFGGVSQTSQVRKIKAGVDVLVATPGRLIDLINQKHIQLDNVEHFVLDEADRMLDMGMIHDVKRIIAKMPKKRQNLLFSATMPKEVTNLVNSILVNPIKVEVTPVSSTVDTISQTMYFVSKKNKKSLLIDILKDKSIESVLVFSRTKHGANQITKELGKFGIAAEAIHGNKSQNARQTALSNFKEGRIRALVATDIAARGIDVDELSHVINYDLPEVPETYVHRIGRTGRAGAKGEALSFCDEEDTTYLRQIQKVIGKTIPVVQDHLHKVEAETMDELAKEYKLNNPKKSSGMGGKSRSNNSRGNSKKANEGRKDSNATGKTKNRNTSNERTERGEASNRGFNRKGGKPNNSKRTFNKKQSK